MFDVPFSPLPLIIGEETRAREREYMRGKKK